MDFEQKAKELGYKIDPAKQIEGKPQKAIRTGNLVYTSGQLSINGEVHIKGRVGKEVTIEQGYEAAKFAALNCLAAIKTITGSLDKVTRVVKVLGMVNIASHGHEEQEYDTSKVINGCSDLIHEIFGEAGLHARSAVGMTLPRNYAVEIEMIVEVEPA